MLMKWEDLEAGDVIRVKDEAKYLYRNLYPRWVKTWCDKNIKVHKIEIGVQIKIYFDSYNCIRINKDGTGASLSYNYKDIPLFEIVALKDD